MKAPTILLCILICVLPAASGHAADHAAHTQPAVSAETALARLKAGNVQYAKSNTSSGHPTAARRAEIAQAQHPLAVIVACSDSRVSPEIVFDQKLGDLFVVRSAGNLLDDHSLGSIEYAVTHLGTRLVVVLGHERCGAINAAIGSATAPGHIASIVKDLRPVVERCATASGDMAQAVVVENARSVAARIRAEAVLGEADRVRVLHAIYDLDTGLIDWPAE